jgi:predicted negative regulator of RcsB-dependent stress response
VDKSLQNVIKHDQVLETVEHASEYVSSHRKQVLIYAGAALLVAVLGYFGWTYFQAQKKERQLELGAAVGLTAETTNRTNESIKTLSAAYQKVIDKYPGSDEANLAKFIQGTFELEQGDAAKGEKMIRESMNADRETASLAKYAVADMELARGNAAEAEKLLRELVASPTYMLPKEQATIQLARVISKSKPEEARKLLEPLRAARSPISTPAIEILGTLPPAPGTPAKK